MRKLTFEQKQKFDRDRDLLEDRKLLSIKLRAAFEEFYRERSRKNLQAVNKLMDICCNVDFLLDD